MESKSIRQIGYMLAAEPAGNPPYNIQALLFEGKEGISCGITVCLDCLSKAISEKAGGRCELVGFSDGRPKDE